MKVNSVQNMLDSIGFNCIDNIKKTHTKHILNWIVY